MKVSEAIRRWNQNPQEAESFILNEDGIAMSSIGNHTTAVSEDYEKLAIALRGIIAKIGMLTSISIGDQKFEIECSDLKFLVIVE